MHPSLPSFRRPLPFLLGLSMLLWGLVLPTPAATAEEGHDATWEDLEMLEDMLDDDGATNREIRTYMDLVVTRAASPAPADAEKRKGFEKYRSEVLDVLLEALDETDLDSSGENNRDEVNRAAGPHLATVARSMEEESDRKRLTRRILRKIKRLEKARHDVPAEVYEGAFRALAGTGMPSGLAWLMDNYLHTRKQPKEIARLRAAMRAMRTYDAMPAKMRVEMTDEMIKRYLAMEDLANTSSTAVTALAAKQFWDAVRTDAIPLLQYVTGYPMTPEGTALATVRDFRDWFKEHENHRKEPWTLPLGKKGADAKARTD